MKNKINAFTYSLLTLIAILLIIYLWNSNPLWITLISMGFAILFTIHLYCLKIIDELKKLKINRKE